MSGKDFSEFPEFVEFEGIGNSSLLHIHLIALAPVGLGIVFAILAPPGGYVALVIFIIIGLLYDLFFLRRSQRPVRVKLFLRTDPVQATFGESKIGEIKSGTLVTELESGNELGYRAAPNRQLSIWIFDSADDAKIAARRLSMYLPQEK